MLLQTVGCLQTVDSWEDQCQLDCPVLRAYVTAYVSFVM